MKNDKTNSILIIQLAGLGDMVMATPAFEALRGLYPEAKICLLTNSRSADIVQGSPYLDEIFILGGTRNAFSVLKKLRSRHFDTVINLYRLHSLKGVIKMFLLFFTIGGKFWVGRDTDGRGLFYHLRVPETKRESRHEVECKLDIIRELGAVIDKVNFRVEYDKSEESFIRDFLNKKGVEENDVLVGINCSTFRPSRNWRTDSYARLADMLISELNVTVAFLGLETDKDIFMEIKKRMEKEPLDFIGTFSVRQMAAFLKQCSLLISPDSGPVHVANALGLPMVVLFGPGEYDRYRPYANREKVREIKKSVDCAPCFKKNCDNQICMDQISSQEVFEAARQLLGKINE